MVEGQKGCGEPDLRTDREDIRPDPDRGSPGRTAGSHAPDQVNTIAGFTKKCFFGGGLWLRGDKSMKLCGKCVNIRDILTDS